VRAAARGAARRPHACFAVVGGAEAPVELEYQRRVEALVAELGLGDRVPFCGARRDMPAAMAALDLFVLTSRNEGFGRVVGEAMAAGRPLVVTDEGAPPELVGAGRFGLCARPQDARDFADKILRLLSDPDGARARAGAAAGAAAEFDVGRIADRVWTRYERLVKRGV